MARYKRRRGRPGTEQAEGQSNFDFDLTQRGEAADAEPAEELDVWLDQAPAPQARPPILDSVALDWQQPGDRSHPAADAEWSTEPGDDSSSPRPEVEPVEIVLESGAEDEGDPERSARTAERLSAPIGSRLAAGLVDALVLGAAVAIFAGVFYLSGGRLRARDPSWIALIMAAASFVVLYFGLFTAVTFATPGQSAMGLRVAMLDGRPPDGAASRRRAFGYLVSAGALMIGFVWAVFDSDGLTWHDRMSGTCLVAAPRLSAAPPR